MISYISVLTVFCFYLPDTARLIQISKLNVVPLRWHFISRASANSHRQTPLARLDVGSMTVSLESPEVLQSTSSTDSTPDPYASELWLWLLPPGSKNYFQTPE